MASADDQIYAAEAGGVLQRLGGAVSQRQRQAEGIMSADEAARAASSQAAADEEAATQGEVGVGSGVAGGVGLTTSLVRGVIKAKRAAKALGRARDFIRQKADVSEAQQEIQGEDATRVRMAGEEPAAGPSEVGTQPTLQAGTSADVAAGESRATLRGIQGQMRATLDPEPEPPAAPEPAAPEPAAPDPAPTLDAAPAPPVPAARPTVDWLGDDADLREGPAPTQPAPATLDQTPAGPDTSAQSAWDSNYQASVNRTPAQADLSDAQANLGDAADDALQAGKQAASQLQEQISSKAASATDFLETAASKYGLKGANLGDILGSTPEELGDLVGGIGGDISGGGGALAAVGGAALESLGPLSMFAGVGLGIYSAWEEGKQEETAKDNAAKYNADVNALSAAPELSTGSIAMPVMDSTAFRSGGISNF
jgi:hypothetical protein